MSFKIAHEEECTMYNQYQPIQHYGNDERIIRRPGFGFGRPGFGFGRPGFGFGRPGFGFGFGRPWGWGFAPFLGGLAGGLLASALVPPFYGYGFGYPGFGYGYPYYW